MNLAKKLQGWADASLITPDQCEGILAFEEKNAGSRWKNGITMTGLFSILLGVALIVAANWHDIPDAVKLALHFVLNAVLAALIWIWRDTPARAKWREGAVFVFSGLTMTLIALIGQIYQVQSDIDGALKLWFWLVTPVVLVAATNRYTVTAWTLLLFYVTGSLVQQAITHLPADWWFWGGLAAHCLMSFVLVAQYFCPAARRVVPVHSTVIMQLALAFTIIATSLSTLLHYSFVFELFASIGRHWLVFSACFLPLASLVWFALRRWLQKTGENTAAIDIVYASALFTLAQAIPLPFHDAGWLAAGMFILYWLLLGAAWQQQGWARGVSLAVAMVSLRLLAVFFEVFGTQLMTGFGLIITGLVLLLLVRIARKVDRALKERMQP